MMDVETLKMLIAGREQEEHNQIVLAVLGALAARAAGTNAGKVEISIEELDRVQIANLDHDEGDGPWVVTFVVSEEVKADA